VDALVLLALMALSGSLLASVVGARVASSSVNFAVNRLWVFRRRARQPAGREAIRYWVLAVALLLAGYGALWALTGVGVPLLVAKVGTDLALFVVGYQVQRTAVFAGTTRSVPAAQRSHSERSVNAG